MSLLSISLVKNISLERETEDLHEEPERGLPVWVEDGGLVLHPPPPPLCGGGGALSSSLQGVR